MIGFNCKKIKSYSTNEMSGILTEFYDYSLKLWRENYILNQDLKKQKSMEEELKAIN